MYLNRLTIWTSQLMTKDIVLVDVYGKQFTFSITNMRWMITTGWISYLFSLIATYIYYKIHPSYCNLGWKAIKNRLTINDARKQVSDDLQNGALKDNTPQTQHEIIQENTRNSLLQPIDVESILSPNSINLTPKKEDTKGKKLLQLREEQLNNVQCVVGVGLLQKYRKEKKNGI